MRKLLFLLYLVCFLFTHNPCNGQTFVFAQLNGSPNINTAGWNLTGNAYAGDTGGDVDASPNELILTNASGNQSGGVFYGTPINPLICSKWTVEFDYRIWGGSAADGLAFCFLDVPPTGFVNGQGVGIPGTANGLKVIIDTWDNGCGVNPELQIFSGVGYNECIAGIVKLTNAGNNLNFIRNNSYQPVKITYVNGAVTLFINNIQYLTANFPINFSGYMGFTASTGGATDQHSVRNVVIYTDQASSNAGSDVAFCTGQNAQIGTVNNPANVYSWSPATGLSATNISNPTVTLTNNGNTPVTQVYTVTTSLASSPGVCPTTDQVNVTVYPNLTTSMSASICAGEQYSFNGQSLTTAGIYTANLISLQGCDSIVNLNLSVNPTVNVTIDTAICQGTSFSISGQNLINTGQYNFTFQTASGCDSSVTVNLTVNPLPLPICNSATICETDTAVLTPSGALVYSWSPQLGNVDSQGILTVPLDATTAFTLTGTDNNNCTNSILVTVTVNPLPNIQLLSNQPDYCFGESIVLQATGGVTYNWTQFIGNGAQQNIVAVSNSIFYVSGTDANNCSNSDTLAISVNPNPILQVTPNQEICSGGIAQINVSGALNYFWQPQGSGTSNQFSPSSTTLYTIVGIDVNGCESSISTSIIVFPNPIAELEAQPSITTSDSPEITFLNYCSGATLYFLDYGDGSFSEEQLPSVFNHTYPYTEGNYQVELMVENEFGCKDSSMLYIQVKGDEIFYIPNTFTPDGDEHNNIFIPVFTNGFDPANFQLEIYNRWGELIFQSLNSNKGWDGFYNGKLSPVGTYVWKVIYKNPDLDDYKVVTGHVNLIR